MRIIFRTNLDWYKGVSWPVLDIVPPIGSKVWVHPGSEGWCKVNNIPPQLKVVDHTYYHDRVEVELWYREIDVEAADIAGKLSHLYQQ